MYKFYFRAFQIIDIDLPKREVAIEVYGRTEDEATNKIRKSFAQFELITLDRISEFDEVGNF